MKRPMLALLLVVAATLLLALPAGAITFGQPDGNLHPNVGALLVEFPDGFYAVCTGTLIAPDVFLTASHCLDWLPAEGLSLEEDVYVTFDTELGPAATRYHGVGHLHPLYPGPRSNTYDIAVVVLDDPVLGITPASLPTAGLLDQMKADKTLKTQRFVAVGYGLVRDDKTHAWQSLEDTNLRQYAEQSADSLQPYWIQYSMNPSTGNGGTCYGDSGGPHFIKGTDIVASLTVTGDAYCRATDVTYRTDTDAARDFLADFVALP